MALPSTQSSGKKTQILSAFFNVIFLPLEYLRIIVCIVCVLEQLGIEVLILEIWSWQSRQSRTRTEIALRQAMTSLCCRASQACAGEPVRCGVSLPYHLNGTDLPTQRIRTHQEHFLLGSHGVPLFQPKKQKEPQRRFSARVSSPIRNMTFPLLS